MCAWGGFPQSAAILASVSVRGQKPSPTNAFRISKIFTVFKSKKHRGKGNTRRGYKAAKHNIDMLQMSQNHK